jgi:hypothetical protein
VTKQNAPRDGAFSLKIVLALLFVGVFSFSAFMTLSAFAPELRNGDDGRGHALSRSAIGFAGAVQLLEGLGDGVSVSRAPRVHESAPLVIFTPERVATATDIRQRAAHAALIVMPKWAGADAPNHPGWMLSAGLYPTPLLDTLLAKIAPETKLAQGAGKAAPTLTIIAQDEAHATRTIAAGRIASLQTIEGKGLTPVAVTAQGKIVLARAAVKGAPIYILADPDFLNTHGIADLATARAGVAMLDALRPAGGPITFDVSLNGYGRDRSILRTAFTPPFLAATLALAAAALLLGWRAVTQARPVLSAARTIALGKTALTENSAALLRLTHREHKLGPGYAQLTGAQIGPFFGLGEAAPGAETLDRLGASRGAASPYSQLAAEAAAAQNPSRLLEAARRLHDWKETTLRAPH